MTTPAVPGSNVTPISPNAAAWATASGGQQPYSPDNFYTGASDANGFEKMTVKVPMWIYREIQHMVHADEYPKYQSPADVFRDAIYHRFHYIRDNIALPPMRMHLQEATRQMMAEQFVIDVERKIDRRNEYVQSNITQMSRCADLQLWDDLANLIYRARMTMDHESWTGVQYNTLKKTCDDYEIKVPEQHRRSYIG